MAALVAILGLTAASVWGAVGTITALDRVDSYDRTAVPSAMTVTGPGTQVVYYESPADLARYADPTATGRTATPVEPGSRRHQPGAPSGHHADLAAARADGDRA